MPQLQVRKVLFFGVHVNVTFLTFSDASHSDTLWRTIDAKVDRSTTVGFPVMFLILNLYQRDSTTIGCSGGNGIFSSFVFECFGRYSQKPSRFRKRTLSNSLSQMWNDRVSCHPHSFLQVIVSLFVSFRIFSVLRTQRNKGVDIQSKLLQELFGNIPDLQDQVGSLFNSFRSILSLVAFQKVQQLVIRRQNCLLNEKTFQKLLLVEM